MALSRVMKNVLRGAKSPVGGSKGTNKSGQPNVHAKNKQYNQDKGKKDDGPHYPATNVGISTSGSLK